MYKFSTAWRVGAPNSHIVQGSTVCVFECLTELMDIKLHKIAIFICCALPGIVFLFCILIKLWRKYQLADQVRVSAMWVMEIWHRNWPRLNESG